GNVDGQRRRPMPQYLLSVYQPDAPVPPAEVMEEIMRDPDTLNRELEAAGAWVFAGGLHPPSTATVVRVKDGEGLTTDGPFHRGKEHRGGVTLLEGPAPGDAPGWGG